eukprot:ctg_2833.g462
MGAASRAFSSLIGRGVPCAHGLPPEERDGVPRGDAREFASPRTVGRYEAGISNRRQSHSLDGRPPVDVVPVLIPPHGVVADSGVDESGVLAARAITILVAPLVRLVSVAECALAMPAVPGAGRGASTAGVRGGV